MLHLLDLGLQPNRPLSDQPDRFLQFRVLVDVLLFLLQYELLHAVSLIQQAVAIRFEEQCCSFVVLRFAA